MSVAYWYDFSGYFSKLANARKYSPGLRIIDILIKIVEDRKNKEMNIRDTYNEVNQVNSQMTVEQANAVINRAAEVLAKADKLTKKYGKNIKVDDVIRFKVQFQENGTIYSYAATKIKTGEIITTAFKTQAKVFTSWVEFLDYFTRYKIVEMVKATEFVEVKNEDNRLRKRYKLEKRQVLADICTPSLCSLCTEKEHY